MTFPIPIQVTAGGYHSPIQARLISAEGDYFAGNLRFTLEMDWPQGLEITDYQDPSTGSTSRGARDVGGGFFVYEAGSPKHFVAFQTDMHYYACVIQKRDGRTFTLSPRMAGNLKALQAITFNA